MDPFSAHSLPMVTSSQPFDAARQISRFMLRTSIDAPEARSFEARVGGIKFGSLAIALIDTSQRTHIDIRANSNHFLIVFCLSGTGEIDIDGTTVELSSGRGFIARPSRYVRGDFSERHARLLMKVDAALFEELDFPTPAAFEANGSAMTPLFHQVRMLLSSPETLDAIAGDRTISDSVQRLLIDLLHHGRLLLPDSTADLSVASRDVRRAEAFMRTHIDRDLPLEDIVNAAGVSPRSLQKNFIRYRGVTPTRYLLNLRLDHARTRLLSSQRQKVADVALDCGFHHLSRFASAYRKRFGEPPSATLHRAATG